MMNYIKYRKWGLIMQKKILDAISKNSRYSTEDLAAMLDENEVKVIKISE